ncbi:MAG: D-ribose ABC transporter substrate-binding protein [Chloroflexota bacterium]|nr:D-ribose ABC transporter substrate-binding protein [Chloroflexota bacterium]
MKHRKYLIFALLIVLTLILTQCGSPGPAGSDKTSIGLSVSTLNNPFFVTLRDGANGKARELGVDLVVTDAQDDPAKEATNIEDLIQQGVAALLVNPTDGDSVIPSIQKANAAGIPVFTIDRGANGGEIVAHIASDNVAGGRKAAAYICETLGGSGNVVEMEGIAGTSAARERGQGFNEYLAEECPGLEIVAKQTANFNRDEGYTVFENILQANPEIDGVFAHNDEMVLGAIEAAEAADRAEGIVFVGFDAINDAKRAIDRGRLQGTVAQLPSEMGILGVQTAVDHLAGKDVSDYIPVDLALVTAEAVEKVDDAGTAVLTRIGLSLSTLNNPFFVSLAEGAQDAVKAGGFELIVTDAQDDSAKEAANIEDLIQQKVRAIIVNPTDSDAVVPSIQKANQAGIAVFTVDRGANGGEIVSHIASDNVQGGETAGAALCEILGGVGNVVELEGIAGTSAARDRSEGFNKVMASESCSGIEIIARQTANFSRDEAYTVFENILQAEPEIDGVFAHNDEMILGAIEASDAARRTREITFVGFDAIDAARLAVESGVLAATVGQLPWTMGNESVKIAIDHIGGAEVPDYKPIELALISGSGMVSQPAGDYTIGLSLSTLNNRFFVDLQEGAKSQADIQGVKLIVTDAQDDPAKEATNIEDLIQRGVNALLINPTDADAIVPSIQKANQAGIPVLTVDRAAAGGEIVGHIASDNVFGGQMAGEYLCEALEGSGKVVELQGIAGTSAARERGQGFNEYLAAECPGLEIVAQQTANFNRDEGYTVFENILQAQSEIDAVFAHNDEMILGALEAAEDAGRADEINFTGFDAVYDALLAVDSGRLDATIAQKPRTMGLLAVENAVKFLNGDPIVEYIPVQLGLVTLETIIEYAPSFTQ